MSVLAIANWLKIIFRLFSISGVFMMFTKNRKLSKNITATAIIPHNACTATSCEGYYFLVLLALKSVFCCKLKRNF